MSQFHPRQDVWKLIFNAGSQMHAGTAPFLFDMPSAGNSTGVNITISNMMKDWFTSFVVHLNPNKESWSGVPKPEWPTYARDDVMTVNYTEVGPVKDWYFDANEKCDLLWDSGSTVQN